MAWQRLSLRLASDDVPRAEALLKLAGAQALSLNDSADTAVLEPAPGQTPLWTVVELHGLFPSGADLGVLSALLDEVLPDGETIVIDRIEDDDWEHAWRRRIVPRRFGERLWLTPADEPDRSRGDCQLRLNMGLAFGTGEHPTTALCLEWLADRLLPGSRMLDYGCGSGVLALAAIKLGADRVWAVDSDPQALTASADNARLNGVEEALWIGPPDALPDIEVDVVAANILAQPLERLARRFCGYLVPGGQIVLSGILAAQRERVEACYTPYFRDIGCAELDGWIRLVATRRTACAAADSGRE